MSVSKKQLWSAWTIVTFFYAYQYILRVMPSILMDDIVKKFSLSPDAFGQFSGVYYLGYSLMHLPVGILLDRFGPKNILPILIACTSLGLLPILYAESFMYPIIGRVFIGIGSSGAILGVFKVLHMYFESKKFSRFLSFSVTIGLLGAIYGGAPIHFARTTFGFEPVVFALIVVSLALALATYLILPKPVKTEQKAHVLSDVKKVFSNKELLLLCFVAGFMVGPLEGFADVWGVQFLKVYHGIQDSVAPGIPSWIFIGMCFGGPILSLIAEKRQNYVEVVLGAACVMAFIFALILSVQLSAMTLSVLFFIVGICSAYQMLMIYQVSTLVSGPLKSLSSVASNMIIMIFGYLFHSLIGKSIGWFAIAKGVDGFRDANVLVTGIAIIPFALLLSATVLAFYVWAIRRRSVVAKA